jgi:alpha-galactosidase
MISKLCHRFGCFLFLLIAVNQDRSLAAEPAWQDIKVEVEASQPITTSQSLKSQENGFDRLSISLSNKGNQSLTIGKISVSIPLAENLKSDLQMVYGGSCMGRTPLLRHEVGSQTAKSSSNFFTMVRITDEQYLFAGSLTWRIFLPNFTLDQNTIRVWSNGEGKQLKPGETIQYEQIVLRRGNDWVDLLNQFGSAIAKENGVEKLKKVDFKGWGSWDYYGSNFTVEDLQQNMEKIKKILPSVNLFQIDAGWATARGDNMSVKPHLPGGMKAVAQRITEAGMMPGIWIDGCRADPASEIFKKHPEYFLRDQNDKVIRTTQKKGDGNASHEIYFDYSHPGARAYMAECIRVITQDWGYRYLKIDFLRFGLEDDVKHLDKSIQSFKAHDPTITGVERFRLGMKAMREAMGPDTYFLGCSAIFGPCIGFVDGMRTGGDIFPQYEAFPERSLANLGHFYLNGKVFNGDADYLTFRAAADEDEKVSKSKNKSGGSVTLNEAKMWADCVSLYGNCQLHSDNLMTLRPERRELVNQVFQYPAMDETIPLDFWQKATSKGDGFEKVLARHDKDIYLGLFNWTDTPESFAIPAFGQLEPVKLEGRHSTILKYAGKNSFSELRRKLQSR